MFVVKAAVLMAAAGVVAGQAADLPDTLVKRPEEFLHPVSDAAALEVGGGMAFVSGGCSSEIQGNSCEDLSNQAYLYDPSAVSAALRLQPVSMPQARYRHAQAQVGSKVFLIGGFGQGEVPLTDIDVFDVATREWSKSAEEMPVFVTDLVAFDVGSEIYYCTGYNVNSSAPENEQYTGNTVTYVLNTETGAIRADGPTLDAHAEHGRGDARVAKLGELVYVVGGWTPEAGWGPVSTMEVFNSTSGTWAVVASPSVAGGDHAVAALDGKLYLFGGEGFGAHSVAEMYDPATDQWAPVPGVELPEPRFRFEAAALGGSVFLFGGQVKVAGAAHNALLNTVHEFSSRAFLDERTQLVLSELATGLIASRGFANHQFEVLPPSTLAHPLSDAAATALGGGRVFVSGGCVSATQGSGPTDDCKEISQLAYIFDAASGVMRPVEMPRTRHRHAAALRGDKVYLIGGYGSGGAAVSEIDVYDLTTEQWSPSPLQMPVFVSDLVAFTKDGLVHYCTGFLGDYTGNTKTYVIDARLRIRDNGPALPAHGTFGRGDARVATLDNGKVYVIGGWTNLGVNAAGEEVWEPVNTMEVFDGARWSEVPASPVLAGGDRGVAALNGRIYVFGGQGFGLSSTVEVYEPEQGPSGAWHIVGELPDQRFRFEAAAAGDSIYLFGGQTPKPLGDYAVLSSVEAFTEHPSSVTTALQASYITQLQSELADVQAEVQAAQSDADSASAVATAALVFAVINFIVLAVLLYAARKVMRLASSRGPASAEGAKERSVDSFANVTNASAAQTVTQV